jgi:hypothetical protein
MIKDCDAIIVRGEDEIPARIIALDDDFSLVTQTPSGEQKLSFGEVRLRL